MALPPIPESPSRKLPKPSQVTPRVGMHLYQNETEDDDVSVLTFGTLNAKENSSSYVRSSRELLERMILENNNTGDDDRNILTRISEEGASENASCYSTTGCDRSPSSKLSKKKEENEGTDADDTTVAESILESADKVLLSIVSSSYCNRRRKTESSESHESPAPQPHPKHPSPYRMAKEDSSPKESISEKENQLEVSSNFLNSYFRDEKMKHSGDYSDKGKYTISTNTAKVGKDENERDLAKLEYETKRLQYLLKERQIESRRANQALQDSIRKAHEFLDSISGV
ncbi:hypothetical protein ACHAXA_010668 [Cyclostephanos tholiformis]|uniref:Uncharacterized protein n=1 Tax=Cyclostephanos tholiformis TaxID=382380 RepID=A0ABD3SEJ7_9STRA